MPRNPTPIILSVLLLLVALAQAIPSSTSTTTQQIQDDPMAHWYRDKWIADGEVVDIINATYARGRNFMVTYDPDRKIYAWRTAQVYIRDNVRGRWVPYIYDGSTWLTEGYITVEAPLIKARLYKGRVEYYKPGTNTPIVDSERWLVFKWSELLRRWLPVCGMLPALFKNASVIEAGNHINVTGVWQSPVGTLRITYHFRENMKHEIEWTPTAAGTYAIIQVWNGTKYQKVKLQNATIIYRTANLVIGKADSLTFLFHNDTQPFGIMESHSRAYHLFYKAYFAGGKMSFHGITIKNAVAWIFYNRTLTTLNLGQTLKIDPTTTTITPPTDDSQVFEAYPDNNYGTYTYMYLRDLSNYTSRIFIRFNLSSIPSDATINIATLRIYYYGYLNIDPVGKWVAVHRVLGGWDESTITWNNAPSYDSIATDNIQMPSTIGWVEWDVTSDVQDIVAGTVSNYGWCVKFQTEGLTSNDSVAQFYPKEKFGYEPELYVEYVVGNNAPSIGEFSLDDIVYANYYYLFNVTVVDPDGQSELYEAVLWMQVIDSGYEFAVKASGINGTPTFSEYSDPSNYITLDPSTCGKISVNLTAYKLYFNLTISHNVASSNTQLKMLNMSWVTDINGANSSATYNQTNTTFRVKSTFKTKVCSSTPCLEWSWDYAIPNISYIPRGTDGTDWSWGLYNPLSTGVKVPKAVNPSTPGEEWSWEYED